MNRNQLLAQLTALDFMAVDLQLFLDSHPCDSEAISRYNDIVSKANILRSEYENICGPLTSYRSTSNCPWQWIDDPWPWQGSFNFKLTRDGGV
jgi:hypothetical protein